MGTVTSIIRTSLTNLTTGERTLEVVTDGRVGAQDDAYAAALVEFQGEAHLSFRKSFMGELRFYYTDRAI